MGRERREKSANFWPPTLQVPNPWASCCLGPPHPSAPHFFWVGASSGLHPSADPSCENHHKHTKKKWATRISHVFLSRLSIFYFVPMLSRLSFFMSRLHFLFCPNGRLLLLCRLRFVFLSRCVFFVLGPPCIVFTPQSDLLPTCLECTVFPNELTLDPPGRPQR